MPTTINKDEDITIFAKTNYRGADQAFGIKRRDRRSHMYLIGKTGTGKSTLLQRLICSDIAAGEGVAVIDPHGDLIQKTLQAIPPHRQADLIYFNPAIVEHALPFNVLERSEGSHSHLVASGLMSVFKKMWADSWGPRLEYILRNTIASLLELRDTTLLDVQRMLVNKEFRMAIVKVLRDEQLKEFWLKEFEQYPPNFRTEAIAAIQNKVGQFLSSKIIRSIVSHKQSAFHMREVMDSGKILLIDLAKGKIGEDASNLLGALLLTSIEQAALSRADIVDEKARRDFYLYIDEFHNFSTASFASILSESRKYRLNITIAHQYIQQLDETLYAAIIGNVGSIISFRVGARDAEYLAKEFYPDVDQQSLINLPNHNIYLKLMINGVASQAFSAVTLPPIPPAINTNTAV